MAEDTSTPFEDALEKTGNGLYNYLLVATCSLILLAIGVDTFGFSLVVAAACDLDLTVSRKGILTSVPFIGILFVSYLWGYISDTRGRRLTLVVCMQAGFVLSCLSSLCPNWIVLAIVKFLSVCFSCAANSATYTLVGESCTQRVRNKYMVLMTCLILLSPAVAGVLTYPTLKLQFAVDLWFGVQFTPWRLLCIVLAVPSGLGAVAVYFCHESPKFLANRGRRQEALEVMRSIYSVNHRHSKDEYEVKSLKFDETPVKKQQSILRAVYEQSAPLFRPPLLRSTLRLYYIVFVVYITNNSFLVWLPHILNLIRLSLEAGGASGNICALISSEKSNVIVDTNGTSSNTTITPISPEICLGTIEENVILTLIASQSIFSFMNFVISYLPNRRKAVLMSVLGSSTAGGAALALAPEPVSSVAFFVLFTCTCLAMGILASYFVDLYPTSYRGMAACLSIMVGRTATFIGINLVGNLIFSHCELTFYLWSLFVFSSLVTAWFLPSDKPPVKSSGV